MRVPKTVLVVLLLMSLLAVGQAQRRRPRRPVEPPVTGTPSERLAKLADQFLRESLQMLPIAASAAGYHSYIDKGTGKTIRLDALLDQMGTVDTAEQTQFYRRWRERIRQNVPFRSLSPQDKADYMLLQDGISLSLLELQTIQNFRHNPTFWVEAIGNALFLPLTTDYAPKQERLSDAVSRVAQIARFLGEARQQLLDSDPIFIKVAVEENAGNLELIDQIGRELAPDGPARRRFQRFSPAAKKALTDFSKWLETDLAARPTSRSWRLGKQWYAQKFRLVMQIDVAPDQLLADAEDEMQVVRSEMLQIATPMHRQMYPDHTDHNDLHGHLRENRIIGEVLDTIGREHPDRNALLEFVQADLADITAFIREKKIVSLSARDNLKVIPTPEFMRGVYSVAGFHQPPPLDPESEAQYWVTPIAPDVPEQQAESKLREYNDYTLHWLTIHEALPGHYVQFEHANNVQPATRRLLRAFYANGPYVEGWAEYIAGVMMEEGFLRGDPKFRLIMRKLRLRLLANTILDVRMHTMDMSDQQAMDLMTQRAFQTHAEAEGKLRRAKLTSVQLPTYYVGARGWRELRQNYQTKKGREFDLLEFHDSALALGPIPIPLAQEILVGIPSRLVVQDPAPEKRPTQRRRRRR